MAKSDYNNEIDSALPTKGYKTTSNIRAASKIPMDYSQEQMFRSASFDAVSNLIFNDFGIVESASIRWSDNSDGGITFGGWNAKELCFDAWVATHADSGKTVTQPTVTRNNNGEIITQPEIIIS